MSAATLSGPEVTRSMTPAMRASRLLGWVSFAIGAAELLAPRKVARAVGMNEDHTTLLRAYGVREVVAGVGAHSVYPVPALWSRVAGDLLDLGTLAVAARQPGGGRDNRAWIAMGAVLGIAVIDAIVASKLADETAEEKGRPKDYSGRSGFPGGIEAARGAGLAGEADGKRGGAAAGDSSPAGESSSGRTSTDLHGTEAQAHSVRGQSPGARSSGGQEPDGQKSGGFIGSGQTMPEDAQEVVPRPASYTPV